MEIADADVSFLSGYTAFLEVRTGPKKRLTPFSLHDLIEERIFRAMSKGTSGPEQSAPSQGVYQIGEV